MHVKKVCFQYWYNFIRQHHSWYWQKAFIIFQGNVSQHSNAVIFWSQHINPSHLITIYVPWSLYHWVLWNLNLVCFCGNWNTCSSIWTHRPPKVLLPLCHEDHFWPLTALNAPQAPPHPAPPAHIRAPNMAPYWLVWNPPPQDSLLILAALPPSQEDNLLWLPSISHLLTRSISFPLSLSVDFHSTPLCCYMHATPPPPTTNHPLAFFLSVSLQLFF